MKVQALVMQQWKEEPVVMIFSAEKTVGEICKIVAEDFSLEDRFEGEDGEEFEFPTSLEELGDAIQMDLTLTTEDVR